MLVWWNDRKENEQAWKVSIKQIKQNGYNLDIKNPFVKQEEYQYTTEELLQMLSDSFKRSAKITEELKNL